MAAMTAAGRACWSRRCALGGRHRRPAAGGPSARRRRRSRPTDRRRSRPRARPICCSASSAPPTRGSSCSTATATWCCTTRAPCELGRRRRRAGPTPGPSRPRRARAADRRAGRGRPVAAGPARPPPDRRARPGAPARRRLHDGRGHRHLRRRAAGGHPARLRRQRQPRAQDARSARSGCSPRPCSTPPTTPTEVRRFGTKILSESDPAGQPRHRADRAVPAHRRRTAARAVAPSTSTRSCSEALAPQPALRRGRAASRSPSTRPTGLEVDGDQTLLVTALSNLLENAIAYSPAEASVSVSRRRVGDDWVEIAVTDRGIGIAPEHQQRVFERFFRVDPARSRATGGTGLGLAIVKHVLANHGGEVRLWSSPGTGSTFTMRLPARVAAPRGIDRPRRTPPTTPRRRPPSEGRHDQGADRRGRGVLRRPARLPAPQGGLHHGRRRRPARTRWRSSTATAPTSCCST